MTAEPVSAEVMARWLGVGESTVRKLAQRKIAVRTGPGLYDLEATVRNYCGHLRETASGRGGENDVQTLTSERARLARERADGAALKNAALRGELVPAAEVESEWSGILRFVRAGMLSVPSRAAQRLPHLSAHDEAEIDAEVRAAFGDRGLGKRTNSDFLKCIPGVTRKALAGCPYRVVSLRLLSLG